MSLSIYLVFLIVLLAFNLLFWILVIWFRIFFGCGDCRGSRRNPGSRRRRHRSHSETPSEPGYGNPGFNDEEEDPARARPRPYSITERMETPPSYEDAIKQERFGFIIPTEPTNILQRSELPSLQFLESQNSQFVGTASSESTSTDLSSSLPIQNSSHSAETENWHRSHTFPARQLSTISEENDDAHPVSVVIDRIGIQTARIMRDTLDPTVQLSDGEQLRKHSKC